jgi:hypothetical protein
MYSLVVYSCVLFIASCELYTCISLLDMKLREQDVTFRRRLLMSVSTKWFGTACVCSVVSAARPRATDVLLKTDTDGYGARRSALSVHLVTDWCWQSFATEKNVVVFVWDLRLCSTRWWITMNGLYYLSMLDQIIKFIWCKVMIWEDDLVLWAWGEILLILSLNSSESPEKNTEHLVLWAWPGLRWNFVDTIPEFIRKSWEKHRTF